MDSCECCEQSLTHKSCLSLYRQHLTVRTHAHFVSQCTLRTPDVITRLAQGLDDLLVCLTSQFTIGHVYVECSFDPVSSYFLITYCLTDATYCLTDATDWNQIKTPCATPLWSGPSGHLADPIPNIGYEPKFCIDVSGEHTPINLPTRNMSFQQEYDLTITASEDLNLPRHSGASSSSQQTAASTVPALLKLGSSGTRPQERVGGL